MTSILRRLTQFHIYIESHRKYFTLILIIFIIGISFFCPNDVIARCTTLR